MTGIEISRAQLADIDSILSIQSDAGLSPWPRQGYEAELERPESVFLVARTDDDATIGFVVGRVLSPQADIYNIGIDQAFLRQGIASALLDDFIQTCHRRSVLSIWLDVRPSNHRAIAFYLAKGFTRAGNRRDFYTDPAEDADIMCLDLSDRK